MLAALARDPAVGKDAAASWREALVWLAPAARDLPLLREWLKSHPGDSEIARHLDRARNASTVKDGFAALDRGDLKEAQRLFDAAGKDPDAARGRALIAERRAAQAKKSGFDALARGDLGRGGSGVPLRPQRRRRAPRPGPRRAEAGRRSAAQGRLRPRPRPARARAQARAGAPRAVAGTPAQRDLLVAHARRAPGAGGRARCRRGGELARRFGDGSAAGGLARGPRPGRPAARARRTQRGGSALPRRPGGGSGPARRAARAGRDPRPAEPFRRGAAGQRPPRAGGAAVRVSRRMAPGGGAAGGRGNEQGRRRPAARPRLAREGAGRRSLGHLGPARSGQCGAAVERARAGCSPGGGVDAGGAGASRGAGHASPAARGAASGRGGPRRLAEALATSARSRRHRAAPAAATASSHPRAASGFRRPASGSRRRGSSRRWRDRWEASRNWRRRSPWPGRSWASAPAPSP